MRIVVLGQAANIRHSVVDLLRGAGHEVRDADGMNAALEKFGEKAPDLLLMNKDVPRHERVILAATVRVKYPDTRMVVILPESETGTSTGADLEGFGEILSGMPTHAELLAIVSRSHEASARPDLTTFGKVSENEIGMLERLFLGKEENARGRWLLGFAYYRAGRFEDARPLLEEAVRSDPANTEARYYLGSCHYRLGDAAIATGHWQAVVRSSPGTQQAKRAEKHLKRVQRGSAPSMTVPPPRP